jgi:DNA-binding PadR family transcriptional regulator
MDPITLLATFAAGALLGALAARISRRHRPSTEAILLAELANAPGFGLDLKQRVLVRFGVDLGQGIYATLRALEREGILRSYEVHGPESRGGRPRIMYALNERRLAA